MVLSGDGWTRESVFERGRYLGKIELMKQNVTTEFFFNKQWKNNMRRRNISMVVTFNIVHLFPHSGARNVL